MDESQGPNIQNDYFNQARREKARVAVLLSSGRRLSGRIRSFDKFTILLDTAQGEQIVFKHAIATVGPDAPPAANRSRAGFSNRMELDRTRGGGQRARAVPAVEGDPSPAAEETAAEEEKH
jgi:host factor-I protein